MIIQTWKMAWSAVCSKKMRTFLTMLGIIIGVTSLIVLVSIAGGAADSVSDQISEIGTNYLSVRITDDKENPLRLSEFDSLLEDESIEEAAPVNISSLTGKGSSSSGNVNVYGTTGSYFSIMGLSLTSGRVLKGADVENHSYVIVISSDTAEELFGYENAVGEELTLGGYHFQVVGILDSSSQTQGFSMSSDSEEDSGSVILEGYIPHSTLTRIADNALDITQFYVSSADEESMDETERTLTQLMLERFGNDEDAFSIQNQSEIMEAMEEVNNTMALMLGAIAAISLLVGGIGIMNIMLVSVTERTREIGIRKAIGARKWMITLQFLMEAVIVSMAGCGAGIALSWVILQAANHFMGDSLNAAMDKGVVLAAVVFSAFIGIIFGLYPARKAANKKPIEALRYT